MTAPSIVRIAGSADHQDLWRLFLQAHHENGFFPLDPTKADWFLQRALNPSFIPEWDTGPRGAIGVIGDVGELEGFVFVILGGYWYSSQRHLEELTVYVSAEHRKSGHAKALIEWMKAQADRTGLPLVTGIISNHRTEAKVRLYERMLPKCGAFFVYGGKGSVIGSSVAYG